MIVNNRLHILLIKYRVSLLYNPDGILSHQLNVAVHSIIRYIVLWLVVHIRSQLCHGIITFACEKSIYGHTTDYSESSYCLGHMCVVIKFFPSHQKVTNDQTIQTRLKWKPSFKSILNFSTSEKSTSNPQQINIFRSSCTFYLLNVYATVA